MAYSLGLLQSDDAKAVLNGTRVLRALTYHQSAAVRNDAFRRIGITIGWSPTLNFRLMLAIYAVLAGTVSTRVYTLCSWEHKLSNVHLIAHTIPAILVYFMCFFCGLQYNQLCEQLCSHATSISGVQ